MSLEQVTRLRHSFERDPALFEAENPLATRLLRNKDLSSRDLNTLFVEILQGGIDAVRGKYIFLTRPLLSLSSIHEREGPIQRIIPLRVIRN